jgi:diguanylate cyclase
LRLPDLPQHHKQAALERVLINFGNQPEELNLKLSALVRNWSALPVSAKPSKWSHGALTGTGRATASHQAGQ